MAYLYQVQAPSAENLHSTLGKLEEYCATMGIGVRLEGVDDTTVTLISELSPQELTESITLSGQGDAVLKAIEYSGQLIR